MGPGEIVLLLIYIILLFKYNPCAHNLSHKLLRFYLHSQSIMLWTQKILMCNIFSMSYLCLQLIAWAAWTATAGTCTPWRTSLDPRSPASRTRPSRSWCLSWTPRSWTSSTSTPPLRPRRLERWGLGRVKMTQSLKRRLYFFWLKKSGIDQLVPNMKIDDYLFEPCGYSMNGVLLNVNINEQDEVF